MTLPRQTRSGLVGSDVHVRVAGGGHRRYVDLDSAATTSASEAVLAAVEDFLPWYSSVHRGAGGERSPDASDTP